MQSDAQAQQPTPADLARAFLDEVKKENPDSQKLLGLVEAGAKTESLHFVWAAFRGQTKVVQAMIAKGASLDETDSGKTALEWALGAGKAETAAVIEKEMNTRSRAYWMMAGPEMIARVSVCPPINLRLTEVFNFSSMERTVVSQNIKTKEMSTSPPQKFDDVATPWLEQAYGLYRERDGKAAPADVFHGRLRKGDGL